MPDDPDHEVIDSPQALFRHLYEAHGLVEALDLDPATAPLQLWLRKHAELERAATRVALQERVAASPVAGARAGPGPAPSAASKRSQGRANRGGAGQDSEPRFRPFADPLVEAIAAALVGRGMEERAVRRGLSTFTGADGCHGEEAVRAGFVAPMLEAIAARLAADPPSQSQRPAAEPQTWVAQPLAAPRAGPEPDADFMAIADVLQERRRSRRGGRREAATPSAAARGPRATPPPATPPPPREPDDDVMALADALQRRRGSRPH